MDGIEPGYNTISGYDTILRLDGLDPIDGIENPWVDEFGVSHEKTRCAFCKEVIEDDDCAMDMESGEFACVACIESDDRVDP